MMREYIPTELIITYVDGSEKNNGHVNLDTARAEGFSISEKFVKQADKVIDSQKKLAFPPDEKPEKKMAILQRYRKIGHSQSYG